MEAPLSGFVVATLLLGLRIVPVLAFAPPFTLTRLPAAFRLVLGLGLAGLMVAGRPVLAAGIGSDAGSLVSGGLRELGVSLSFIAALQMMFAALYVAGRTVDIQAGFGLGPSLVAQVGRQPGFAPLKERHAGGYVARVIECETPDGAPAGISAPVRG